MIHLIARYPRTAVYVLVILLGAWWICRVT